MLLWDRKARALNTLVKCSMWQERTDNWWRWAFPLQQKWHWEPSATLAALTPEEPLCRNLQPDPLTFLFPPAVLAVTGKAQRWWAGQRMGFLSRPWDWVGERFYMMISFLLSLWKKKKGSFSVPFLIYHHGVSAVGQPSCIIHAIKSLQLCKIVYPTSCASKSASYKPLRSYSGVAHSAAIKWSTNEAAWTAPQRVV